MLLWASVGARRRLARQRPARLPDSTSTPGSCSSLSGPRSSCGASDGASMAGLRGAVVHVHHVDDRAKVLAFHPSAAGGPRDSMVVVNLAVPGLRALGGGRASGGPVAGCGSTATGPVIPGLRQLPDQRCQCAPSQDARLRQPRLPFGGVCEHSPWSHRPFPLRGDRRILSLSRRRRPQPCSSGSGWVAPRRGESGPGPRPASPPAVSSVRCAGIGPPGCSTRPSARAAPE
jgi:hypothetical protein